MNTSAVMTRPASFLTEEATLRAAADRMLADDTGFLPVADRHEQRLVGAVTDRDIVVRGIAKGRDADATQLSEVMTESVLYCFENDDVHDVARNMQENDCYRLVVLDDPETKRMTGIVTLGDIAQGDKARVAGDAARGIHVS